MSTVVVSQSRDTGRGAASARADEDNQRRVHTRRLVGS
jgi:hypothetical protein